MRAASEKKATPASKASAAKPVGEYRRAGSAGLPVLPLEGERQRRFGVVGFFEASSAGLGGSGLALFERSEFSQTPLRPSNAAYRRVAAGDESGSPFLW